MYILKDTYIWKKAQFVLYDLEYSGNLKNAFGKKCSIWEIAATCGDKEFYVLINPYLSKAHVDPPVDERYRMPTKDEFVQHNAVSFVEGIRLFAVFLQGLLKSEDQYIVLCSHNGFRGDKLVLEHELITHNMFEEILQLPIYFFDTLYFIRQHLPNETSYSIPKLYKSLFKENIKNVHAASSDVVALKRILQHINKPLEGPIFMLYLTPFSNINGIGTFLQNKFFLAGYTCIEHFFYTTGFEMSDILEALLNHNIINNDIYKLNRVAVEMQNYGFLKFQHLLSC